jgi:heptosyltransferase-2
MVETARRDARGTGRRDACPATMKRLLIRGTNWLGDAVMTTPALMRLREKFPVAHIALSTPEKLAQLWLHHPAVDEVISVSPGEGVFAAAGKLRAGKFDTALVLPNSPRSAMEVFLAHIPERIGYARPWRNFFLTRAVAPRHGEVKMRKRTVGEIKALIGTEPACGTRTPSFSQSTNQARDYLHLAAAMGASAEPLAGTLSVAPEEVEAARQKFGVASISNPIFGLNAGAEYGPAKRWPIERYIAAAKELRKRTNCAWILFGGNKDAGLANQIQSAMDEGASIFNVAGKTSLRELMSLLKLCRVFLTNDTGPMHVAAALGVPVAVIFGSTSPELTAPAAASGSRLQILASDAPCSPCFLRECPIDFRCMNGIRTEPVVEAVMRSAGEI